MISENRLAANRANARLSTGPRTEEGKARSSQNARTHGLTARDLVVRDDEREEFQELLASFQSELDPLGALEQTLFDEIVHAAWNLRRIRRLEASLATSASDPILDDTLEPTLNRLARYQARFERTLSRSIRDLRALQTNRFVVNELIAPEDRAGLSPLAAIVELPKGTHQTLFRSPVERALDDIEHDSQLLMALDRARAAARLDAAP